MASSTELIIGESRAKAVLSFSHTASSIDESVMNVINGFFESISNSVRMAARVLVGHAEGGIIYKISVCQNSTFDGNKLRVERHITVRSGPKNLYESEKEYEFLIVGEKYFKILKNSKKQRFIPLWKRKNIKKQN